MGLGILSSLSLRFAGSKYNLGNSCGPRRLGESSQRHTACQHLLVLPWGDMVLLIHKAAH